MKVLTSDAVQDPTRVEARVRREVAMRKHTHDKMNAERKLTDEQRREKIDTKKAEEDKKGQSAEECGADGSYWPCDLQPWIQYGVR